MRRSALYAAALALIATGCGDGSTAEPGPCALAQSCDDSIIVDVAWLEANFDDPDLQVIDARESGYETSRIPGAIHLPPLSLATEIDNVMAQAMPAMQAEPVLQAAGLRNDTTAVVYGAPPEINPARIVWLLSYYQHGDVRYLDGGFAAWSNGGGTIETDPPSVTETDYSILAVNDGLRVTGSWVLTQLGEKPYDSPAIQLVDARSSVEFEDDHIPSADNVDWMDNLSSGFLRPADELDALYPGLEPAETVVTYCTAGWRASVAWLTLTYLGYEDVRVYDGSWLEWGNGSFPVE